MSLYDTIRCIKYDPAYLVREHADSAIAILPIIVFFFAWAAL